MDAAQETDAASVTPPGSVLERIVAAWPEPALVAERTGGIAAMNELARALLQVPAAPETRLADLLGADVAAALLAAGREPVERLVGDDAAPGRHAVLRARSATLGTRHVVVCLADASGESRLRTHLGLAERLASIGELLSSVAHELNNPLTTVLGYSDLLLSEDNPHLPRAEVERIRSEALRCRRIVGNLLDLARSDALELRPLVVSQVVEKVVEIRGYACNAAGIDLVLEIGEAPVVLGDFHRLVQAVLNLVTNAEDAIRHDAGERRICVRTRAAGSHARIEVEDTGDGVPVAVRPFVFQPFFTTKPRGKGTGLGLSLVRTTARAHGGDVHCEDGRDRGARFVIELPAASETG